MAGDDSGGWLLGRVLLVSHLDGTRPSGTGEWVSPVVPVVTQAAVGAGHWAAGRRQRALAAWASAVGFALMAWGLGTEAPTRAEAQENIERHKDLLRERGIPVPDTAGTTPGARRLPIGPQCAGLQAGGEGGCGPSGPLRRAGSAARCTGGAP